MNRRELLKTLGAGTGGAVFYKGREITKIKQAPDAMYYDLYNDADCFVMRVSREELENEVSALEHKKHSVTIPCPRCEAFKELSKQAMKTREQQIKRFLNWGLKK